MNTILIVDDDVKIARIIARYLEQAGFATMLAHDGAAARYALSSQSLDLLILDVLLPDTSGLQILHELRQSGGGLSGTYPRSAAVPGATAPDVPVLMLSALGMTDDIIGGLHGGADDYLVKPFEPRELVERVLTLLRRQQRSQKPAVSRFGNLWLDLASRRARCGDLPIDLARREYDLLAYLTDHPGRVFERGQLLDAVWGSDFDGSDRSVDLCVLRLRGKLEKAGVSAIKIDTCWGTGYRMVLLADQPKTN